MKESGMNCDEVSLNSIQFKFFYFITQHHTEIVQHVHQQLNQMMTDTLGIFVAHI